MPSSINISARRSLKLNNVLIRNIADEEIPEFVKIAEMMDNYIKSKGSYPVGPLMQRTCIEVDEEGVLNVFNSLLWQSGKYIHNMEPPYSIESTWRVRNCLYTRFIGEEVNIKYAYDKMGVYAYENDTVLKGATYTVYVDKQDDIITADIFMECVMDE